MDDKNYINGIYNYCNRWCEKCSFTANCLLFTNESRIITREILNNGDFTGLKDILMDDLPDDDENNFEEDGFLFDEEDDEQFISKADLIKDFEEEDASPHELEILADEFLSMAQVFLKSLSEKMNLFQPAKEKLEDYVFFSVYNNFEIVRWYHTFIGAKLHRALMGKRDLLEEDDEEMNEFTIQDINGSAKVAAIGISSTISSLHVLYDQLKDYQKEITELLIIAGKIYNEIETEFPGYKNFKRPGFDD